MVKPPVYPETPPPPAPQTTSTTAIISLVAGIATWTVLPLIGAIVAIVTGHMARKEIRASQGRQSGDGLAIAGLVLGYAQIALLVLSLCLIVILVVLGPAVGNVFSNIIPELNGQ